MPNAISNRRVVIWSAVGGIALVAFVLASLAPLNHNDFMYALAPAVWAQHGALYTDVPFVQAPLTILLNSLLAAVTGNVDIFLPGRVVSILLVLAAVLLPVLNRAKLASIDIWVLYVALCLTNLFVVTNSSEIGNYSISLLFLSAAVTTIDAPGSAAWRGFATCACAGLAVSTKLYFVILCPGLLICFLLSGASAREPRVLLACALGFLVGFAPILFFVARDYQSFLRWNVHIHQLILPTRVTDVSDALSRIGKFTIPFVALMAIPIGFVVAAAVRACRRGGDAMRQVSGRLVLLVSAVLMAVSPVYVFEQYFGPLAFLLLLFAAPWDAPRNATRSMYVVLAGVTLAMQAIVLTQVSSKYVLSDRNLAVAQVLTLQRNARALVGTDYTCERKLYSAQPLFLLQNGIQYPPELAAGPFLMFLRGDAVPARAQFDLDAHIATWNPDIVIWGYYIGSPDHAEDAVDRAIRDYATQRAFNVTSIGQIDGRAIELATRPGCRPPPK